jgi:hypothetical protein
MPQARNEPLFAAPFVRRGRITPTQESRVMYLIHAICHLVAHFTAHRAPLDRTLYDRANSIATSSIWML